MHLFGATKVQLGVLPFRRIATFLRPVVTTTWFLLQISWTPRLGCCVGILQRFGKSFFPLMENFSHPLGPTTRFGSGTFQQERVRCCAAMRAQWCNCNSPGQEKGSSLRAETGR